jgi:hypothetical protein
MVEYIAVNNYMFRSPSRASSGRTITWNKVRPYKIQIQVVSYWCILYGLALFQVTVELDYGRLGGRNM